MTSNPTPNPDGTDEEKPEETTGDEEPSDVGGSSDVQPDPARS